MTGCFRTILIMTIVVSLNQRTVDARSDSMSVPVDSAAYNSVDRSTIAADTFLVDSVKFHIQAIHSIAIDTVIVDTLIIDPIHFGDMAGDLGDREAEATDGDPFEFQVFEDMQFEVNIRNRELHVLDRGERVATYPVAVGKPDWPTRTGRWRIKEVVWNPWWHPPDEKWARNYAIMAPGDPDNPLGRAQLIYDAPRSIHGTINSASIGRAVSHGSIRVENEVAMKLASKVMEYAGAGRDEEWFETVRNNPYRNVRIRLEKPVPIRVY